MYLKNVFLADDAESIVRIVAVDAVQTDPAVVVAALPAVDVAAGVAVGDVEAALSFWLCPMSGKVFFVVPVLPDWSYESYLNIG